MKIFFILSSILLSLEAYADINLNENILSDCKIDQNGVMNGCITREEPIAGISAFEQRKDLKFKYKIDYKYSCKSNRLTNINIVSENDNLTLGNFRYLGGTIEGEANSRLVIKDFSPTNTGRARYNKACKLEITKIEQDFSTASLETIKRDICSMKSFNFNFAQSHILLQMVYSLKNNVGILPLNILELSLNTLKSELEIMNNKFIEPEIKKVIDDIIGNTYADEGSIKFILKNMKMWGQGSRMLTSNLNSMYFRMANLQTSLGGSIYDRIEYTYRNNLQVLKNENILSSKKLLSNLNYEYKILRNEVINPENDTKADYCRSAVVE